MREVRPLAAVVAVIVAVIVGLTGFVVAAPAVAQQPTSFSVRVEGAPVVPGGTATIVGFLFVPDGTVAGRPVELEAQQSGETSFLPVAAALTSSTGRVRLKVQPAVTTHYRLRYAGSEDANAEVSAVVVVRVRAAMPPGRRSPTSISIRAVKPAVLPGAATTVRGRLRGEPQAPLGRRRVVLLAQTAGAGTWQFHEARSTDRVGRVNFLIRPRTHTRYRLTFAGTPAYRSARSGIVDVRMRPVVTIAADDVAVDQGESTALHVSVATEAGPVDGATVELLEREPPGSGARWTVIASTTTKADGTASVLVGPGATTSYRWRSNPVGDVPAGRSGPLRVEVRPQSTLTVSGGPVTAVGFVIEGRLVAQSRPVRDATVTLQAYDVASAAWTDVTTGLTGTKGRVRFVRPYEFGASYRLVYDGPRFGASTSATVTI